MLLHQSGSFSGSVQGQRHLVSHPQGVKHPGNVKGKERKLRPADARTPAGCKALDPDLHSGALSSLGAEKEPFPLPGLLSYTRGVQNLTVHSTDTTKEGP